MPEYSTDRYDNFPEIMEVIALGGLAVAAAAGAPAAVAAIAIDNLTSDVPLPPGVRVAMPKVPRSALSGLPGFQTHHVVPKSLASHPAIKASGFDINAMDNIIDLPTIRILDPKMTVHIGKHRSTYTELFREKLNDVAKRLDAGAITPQQARKEIEDFVDKVRKGLESGDISLNKASDAQPPEKPKDNPKDRGDKNDKTQKP